MGTTKELALVSQLRARETTRLVSSTCTLDGCGVPVRRPFPSHARVDVDPFLLVDEIGPVAIAPGEPQVTTPQPYRGVELYTYVLDGRMTARESDGAVTVVGPGGARLLTTGAGLLHASQPEAAFRRAGGRLHRFEVWINLPRVDKMTPVQAVEVAPEAIPVVRAAGGAITVRVLAGEAFGARAPIATRAPVTLLHCTLAPGRSLAVPLPDAWSAFGYVFRGRARFGSDERRSDEGQAAVFARHAGTVRLVADASHLEVLIGAGLPLGEPVVRYGGLVMTSDAELRQALEEYGRGRFGRVPRKPT